MELDEYFRSLKDKTAGVIGLGVSNRPLVRLLLEHGVRTVVHDKRTAEKIGREILAPLEEQGCSFHLGEDYLDDLTEDVIFRTPGLHPQVPALAAARERGALVTSEMETFFALCPCHIVAVTGSDGKTTTTTLISELLKRSGYTVFLGGNIGTPLLDRIPEMKKDDWAVLELSSFQLHSMHCRPDIAVVTNVSPNHLDVHPSYEDYQQAKKQIFLAQGPEQKTVLNLDNAVTRSFAAEVPGRLAFFSRKERVEEGVYLSDGVVYRAHERQSTPVLRAEEIRIPGLHNVENYMAAFAALDGLVPDEVCRAVAAEFPGVPHRLEIIRVLDGVTYCNDSIASSPTRTIAGLHALRQKPILIAGGYDKHIPFDELGDEICSHVKELFLTGFTAEKIADAVRASAQYDPEKLPMHVIGDFRGAVLAAARCAGPGDIVLLSPACASFDAFKNFEERGNTFRSIVMSLEDDHGDS